MVNELKNNFETIKVNLELAHEKTVRERSDI